MKKRRRLLQRQNATPRRGKNARPRQGRNGRRGKNRRRRLRQSPKETALPPRRQKRRSTKSLLASRDLKRKSKQSEKQSAQYKPKRASRHCPATWQEKPHAVSKNPLVPQPGGRAGGLAGDPFAEDHHGTPGQSPPGSRHRSLGVPPGGTGPGVPRIAFSPRSFCSLVEQGMEHPKAAVSVPFPPVRPSVFHR